MIPEAYKSFIFTIIDKTNNGEVKWEQSTDKSFVLRSKSSTVMVGYNFDEVAGLSFYYFKFFNVKQQNNAGFRVDNSDEDYTSMERLYTLASASAVNIKEKLTAFLEEI